MSKKPLKDLEKLFKEKIEEYRELPSENSWQVIESKLDREPNGIEKDFPFFKKWLFLSVLSIIVLLSCFIYYYAHLNAERRQGNSDKIAQSPIVKTRPGNEALYKEQPGQKEPETGSNKNTEVAANGKVAEIAQRDSSSNNSDLGNNIKNKNERKLSYSRKERYTVNGSPIDKKIIGLYNRVKRKEKAYSILPEIHTENGTKIVKANADSLSKDTNIFGKPPVKRPIDSLGAINNTLRPVPQQNINSQIAKADSIDAFAINERLSADTIDTRQAFEQKHLAFKRYFSIAAVYAPNEINNKLEQGVQHYREDDKNVILQQETIKKSLLYGVLAEYTFSEHWTIQSGLKLSLTTTSIHSKHIFARQDLATLTNSLSYKYNSTAGFTYIPTITGVLLALGDSVKTLPSESNVNYAVVPITLQYSTSLGRLFFVGSAGVNINYLTRATVDTEIDFFGFRLARTYNLQGLKNTYFSGSLGLGVGYTMSDKMSVLFLPAQTFSLGPVNELTPVKKYERSLGFQALLRYRL